MRIWDKYIGTAALNPAGRLGTRQRMMVRIVPSQIVAVASV
jgi:hypothetical protein